MSTKPEAPPLNPAALPMGVALAERVLKKRSGVMGNAAMYCNECFETYDSGPHPDNGCIVAEAERFLEEARKDSQ